MARKKVPENKLLKYRVTTKIDAQTYDRFRRILAQNPKNDMSRLVRSILINKPVRVFTRDLTLDNLMEELTRLRTELKHIGININQMTKKFNSYPDPQRKAFYAKLAFQEHLAVQPRIDRLLDIITHLSKKWLHE
jgi:MobC-like protein